MTPSGSRRCAGQPARQRWRRRSARAPLARREPPARRWRRRPSAAGGSGRRRRRRRRPASGVAGRRVPPDATAPGPRRPARAAAAVPRPRAPRAAPRQRAVARAAAAVEARSNPAGAPAATGAVAAAAARRSPAPSPTRSTTPSPASTTRPAARSATPASPKSPKSVVEGVAGPESTVGETVDKTVEKVKETVGGLLGGRPLAGPERWTRSLPSQCRPMPERGQAGAVVDPIAGSPVYPVGSRVNERGHLEIAGCDVVELAAEFGTPAYIYAEDEMRARARAYREAFERRDRRLRGPLRQQGLSLHRRLPALRRGGALGRRRLGRRAAHGAARRLRPRAHPHARQQQER